MINKIINNVENPIAQVIFAHGAGADMHHDFMEQITALFNQANINVLRFNFPYMDRRLETGKRYPPDRMPKLIDCFTSVIEEVIQHSVIEKTVTKDATKKKNDKPKLPIFIGGKSMGSRVAATLAGDETIASHIQGVFCFGYPFHPAKKPEKLRLEPLQDTRKSIVIVQGERDTLGSEVEITDYQLSSLCQLVFLPDGDHSLKPRVKSGFTYPQHMKSAVESTVDFINSQITLE